MPEPSFASQRTNAALREPIINLVRHQPGRALRSEQVPRSPWALAPIYNPEKKRLHIAISVLGASIICGRDLAYQVADAPPDLAQLARILASDFKHAEKADEEPPKFLFSLPDAYGEWGKGVILASPTPQNFPWIDNPAWAAVSATQLVSPSMDEWRTTLASGREPDQLAIFQAPAPTQPMPWLLGIVRRHRERNPTATVDRNRLRQEILRMVEREKDRLAYLMRWYPEFKIRMPDWMAVPDALIVQAVEAVHGGATSPAPPRESTAAPPVAPTVPPPASPAPATPSSAAPAPGTPTMVRGAARRQGSQTSADQPVSSGPPSYSAGDLGDKDF